MKAVIPLQTKDTVNTTLTVDQIMPINDDNYCATLIRYNLIWRDGAFGAIKNYRGLVIIERQGGDVIPLMHALLNLKGPVVVNYE